MAALDDVETGVISKPFLENRSSIGACVGEAAFLVKDVALLVGGLLQDSVPRNGNAIITREPESSVPLNTGVKSKENKCLENLRNGMLVVAVPVFFVGGQLSNLGVGQNGSHDHGQNKNLKYFTFK